MNAAIEIHFAQWKWKASSSRVMAKAQKENPHVCILQIDTFRFRSSSPIRNPGRMMQLIRKVTHTEEAMWAIGI